MITKILTFLGWFYLIAVIISAAFFIWAIKNAPTEEELFDSNKKY